MLGIGIEVVTGRTIAEWQADAHPGIWRDVLRKRSGGEGVPWDDASIRESFEETLVYELREFDALGPSQWLDNESLAFGMRRAFEVVMADPGCRPGPAAEAAIEDTRPWVRATIAREVQADPAATSEDHYRRYLASLSRAEPASFGPDYDRALRRHARRVFREELAKVFPRRKAVDCGCGEGD